VRKILSYCHISHAGLLAPQAWIKPIATKPLGVPIRMALLVLAACFFDQSEKASAGTSFALLRQG
jgi:hypothetical protein